MLKRLNKSKANPIDADILNKLRAQANAMIIRNTLILSVFCCIVFVLEEMTRIADNKSIFKHVIINCLVVLFASTLPYVLKKKGVNEALISHVLAFSYMVVISTVILSFDGIAFGGVTVWANVIIMVFISMCYFATRIFWVYAFLFGLVWLTIFTVNYPFMWTYIDLSDHVGHYAIFLIISSIALWGNTLIRGQFVNYYEQLKVIEQYSKDLENKNQELQRLDDLKNEFLANTTHELKTPLHSIIGLLEPMLNMQTDTLTPEKRYDIELAISSANRLSSLVGNILDASKLQYEEIILQRQVVDLNIAVEMVCKSFENLAKSKHLTLTYIPASENVKLYADENRLLQVLFNLIGNAIKFTERGTVTVALYRLESAIDIVISDTGIGMSEEQMARIFNAFEQGDASISRRFGGTGLGLNISKRLVELHHGCLSVSSKSGEGSEFVLKLPVTEDIDKASVSLAVGAISTEQDTSAYGTQLALDENTKQLNTAIQADYPKILMVDDEPVNLRIINNILKDERYVLYQVSNGMEALKLLHSDLAFDLVLLDVMMPEMSGFEVCIEIRKRYTLTQLPILFLTAKDLPEDFEIGFNVGANDYLKKPFNAKELIMRIKTLVELKQVAQKAVDAERYFLQSQIKPHFLYNTLNTIASYIRTDADLAREMILELGDYLKENLKVKNMTEKIDLYKELNIIRSYLFIEKARFGERLKVQYAIEPNLTCFIPHLLLQPIVENAVRHGVLEKAEGGTIEISAYQDEAHVLIAIKDNGTGMKENQIEKLRRGERVGTGIGLLNVQKRMQTYYNQDLRIESEWGKGTTITFVIDKALSQSRMSRRYGLNDVQ